MTRGRLRIWATASASFLAVLGAIAAAPAAMADGMPRGHGGDHSHGGDHGHGHGGGLSRGIEAIMHKSIYKHAQWGLLEVDPKSGRTIHAQFPNQFFSPGSDTKLVTISSAWHTLGPDHRFTTPVYAVGFRTGSTLHGNLALVAQGDLTMGGRTRPDGTVAYTDIDHTSANDLPGATLTPENPLAGINQLAQQVRAAGITRVDGDVVIDARLFTPPALDPQPTPLIINDNLIDLLTTPTTPGHAAQLSWRPQVAPYHVTSTVRTVAAGGTTNIQVTASPDGTQISVSGTIAAGSAPQLRVSNIQDPNAFGRTALIEALARAGVSVSAPSTGPNPVGLLPASYSGDPRVAAYVSPVYQQYAKLILKVSHNLGANLALCNQAAFKGSTDCFSAFATERAFLADVAHVDPTQFELEDGRGLTDNRMTPIAAVQLLTYWLHTKDFKAFLATLPILGVNGSNAISCPNCAAKGKVFAKPGTIVAPDFLNDRLAVQDQSEAGYLRTNDGCWWVFAVFMNGSSAADTNGIIPIFNDVNDVTALLQEEARCHPKCVGR
jgi:D-alanyl-D-alanine carboxypeptidase/D-alanyl-D-alanine-endopeptidase (penicillin-binding protein 4)